MKIAFCFSILASNNVSINFLPHSFIVLDLRTGWKFLEATARNGVYVWLTSSISPQALSCLHPTRSAWHEHLGHPSNKAIQTPVSSSLISIPLSTTLSKSCDACSCNKSTKLPFNKSSLVSTSPLQLFYFDVWTAPIPFVMAVNIMSLLLITLPNIYGCTQCTKNSMFHPFFTSSRGLWKIVLIVT